VLTAVAAFDAHRVAGQVTEQMARVSALDRIAISVGARLRVLRTSSYLEKLLLG
jgi:hypothetical protein